MDRVADREGDICIFHSRHRCAVEYGIGGEIDAIEISVLGRDCEEMLAALRVDHVGVLDTSQSCQSIGTSLKWFL